MFYWRERDASCVVSLFVLAKASDRGAPEFVLSNLSKEFAIIGSAEFLGEGWRQFLLVRSSFFLFCAFFLALFS